MSIFGAHQSGIATPQQAATVMAAFDVTTADASALVATLKAWTEAAARMMAGDTAAPVTGEPTKAPADSGEVYGLLEVPDKPSPEGYLNLGNAVTDDVKVMVKTNRMTGVHVTPTVVFNGVVENGISSSFSKEQWEEWLEKNIV